MACVGCAGALIVAGCSGSSGDDSSDQTPDSGTGFPDATPGHDGSIDGASDATLDATHLDSSPSMDSSTDSMTASDSSSTPDGNDGAVADGSPEASGEDGGDAGIVLPAAVAIWDFQDTPGSTTAVDSSGHGHTATLHGTAAIVAGDVADAGASDDGGGEGGVDAGPGGGVGQYGNYLQIDGTAGAFADVTGGPLFDNSQSFSVSTWVYFPSFDNNFDELISADGAHISVFELQLAPLNGGYNSEAAFPMGDAPTGGGGFYYAFSTANPSVGSWYHIVGVYDLSTNPGLLSLYVNGVLQANVGDSRALGSNPIAAVGDFIIGAGKYNDARTNGAVANYVGVRVYSQALSALQVLALYGLNGR